MNLPILKSARVGGVFEHLGGLCLAYFKITYQTFGFKDVTKPRSFKTFSEMFFHCVDPNGYHDDVSTQAPDPGITAENERLKKEAAEETGDSWG